MCTYIMCMSGRKHFPTSLPPTFRFFYPFWNSEDWPQYLSNGATAVVGHSMVSLSCDCSRYSSVCDCSGPALAPTVIDLHHDLELLTAQWQYLTVRWIQHLMFLTGVRVLTVSITIWFLYCYVFSFSTQVLNWTAETGISFATPSCHTIATMYQTVWHQSC